MTQQKEHWQFRPVVCAICGSRKAKTLGYRGGWAHHKREGIATRIVRCRDCGFIYPNPTPFPRDFSHYADPDDYFKGHNLELKIEYFRGILRQAVELNNGQTGRLIDIGCGRGESLVAAKEAGWEAIGLEPSEEFVRYGREELDVVIEHGFMEGIAQPDGSFDVVLLSAVLEHVYEPMSLLKEARRLLKPGGLVFIEVPNEASLVVTAGRFYHRLRGRAWTLTLSPTFKPYHVSGFSPGTLRTACEKTNFDLVRLDLYSLAFREKHQMPRLMLLAAKAAEKMAKLFHAESGIEAWARAV